MARTHVEAGIDLSEKMTDLISCQRKCPIIRKKNCSLLKTNSMDEKETLVAVPNGGLISGQTGRLTIGC
jgi:hypothetical protein